jgi:hypothetical protein
MTLKFLKTASPRHIGYTGVLGRVMFKDGLSTEMVPQLIRDRMAAAMPFIEIDAEGNEEPAGTLHRMRGGVAQRMLPARAQRQSEEEKALEVSTDALAKQKIPQLETRESLEAIADQKGIAGVREIADKWGVKHRSINALIAMVLEEQTKAMARRGAKVETPAEPEPEPEQTANPDQESASQDDGQLDLLDAAAESEALLRAEEAEEAAEAMRQAAASGDLTAALNTDAQGE